MGYQAVQAIYSCVSFCWTDPYSALAPSFSETMVPISTLLTALKLSMALILASWACIWIIRPTQMWKKPWHAAEDSARMTVFGDYGLTIMVYCFPILTVASMGYIYLHLSGKLEKLRKRRSLRTNFFTRPLIIKSPVGIVTGGELVVATIFIGFLLWTYCTDVAGDFKKMTPYKSLKLNRWQLKMMHMGVRIGSLSEACLVLLFLPILRGMSIFRIIGIEFESSVRYHVWIANGMMLLSVLHGISIMFIWSAKNCLLQELIKWQKTGRVNIAGAIALATGIIIWITSLPQIRRSKFQLFYMTHHLYIVFILFILLHVGDRHFYLVFAGVLLFAIDKVLRVIESRKSIHAISARILPCKAVELTLPKDPNTSYNPTSIIFLKISSISTFQWHPFTITSSSNMTTDKLSLLVKCQGQWTNNLYNLLNSVNDEESGHLRNLVVEVEGPYGPATSLYQRYDSLVLIAGGSGVTPSLSIMQDIASGTGNIRHSKKILLIYAVKRLPELSMLALTLSPLLRQSAELGHLKLKLFVTQEDEPPAAAREILQNLSQVKTINLDNTSPENFVARSDGLLWKAAITGIASLVFLSLIILLNHTFLHQEGKVTEKSSLKKPPSWISDLLLLCSFIITLSCCTVLTVLSTWRRSTKKDNQHIKQNAKVSESGYLKGQCCFDNAEINFGKRPNLQDILSQFLNEAGESKIGVFVCGPRSMQESVAAFSRANFKMFEGGGGKSNCMKFHSMNFSL